MIFLTGLKHYTKILFLIIFLRKIIDKNIIIIDSNLVKACVSVKQ